MMKVIFNLKCDRRKMQGSQLSNYRCIVNAGRSPGVVCGHATHDLKQCTLAWGLCKYQRPQARTYSPREKRLDKPTDLKQ